METLPANYNLNFEDKALIATIKDTVAKGATDTEFRMFVELCKSTGLNPLKKEVWFIKTQRGAQIMTGINGYLQIANRHPQFDGMTEPQFEQDAKGFIISCRVEVHRKDRKLPAVGKVFMAEYGGITPIWQKMPRVMLAKVAKSVALREAFPVELCGVYTQEEMPPEFAPPKIDVTPSSIHSNGTTIDTTTGEVTEDIKAEAAVQAIQDTFPGTTEDPTVEKEPPGGYYFYSLPYKCDGYDMAKMRKDLSKKFGKALIWQEELKIWGVPEKLKGNFPFEDWQCTDEKKFIRQKSEVRDEFFKALAKAKKAKATEEENPAGLPPSFTDDQLPF